jgi:hypothetical protein
MYLLILRHKRAIQITLPVLLTADAVHNAFIMYRLYIDRLEVYRQYPPYKSSERSSSGFRALDVVFFSLLSAEQDWERERQEDILAVVTPTLHTIHVQCQHKDRAFWPKRLSSRTPAIQDAVHAPLSSSSWDPDFDALGVAQGCVLCGCGRSTCMCPAKYLCSSVHECLPP